MIRIGKLLIIVGFVCGISVGSSFGSATNIFITQNGSTSGSCTAGVQTPAFFNNSANWGNSSNQIGPGTTVLLCGTFSSSAQGGNVLTVQGDGSSSGVVTVAFDSGAQMNSTGWWGAWPGGSCPGCAGAITIDSHKYITVDGRNVGVIQNLSAGSPGQTCASGGCSTRPGGNGSAGVMINSADHVTIENLTIQNIYVNGGASSSASDSGGYQTVDIRVDGGSTNITVTNCNLGNASINLSTDTSGSTGQNSGIDISKNTLVDAHWSMNINGSGSVNIHSNDISGWTNWAYPTDSYHTDGIITWGDSSVMRPYIYDNYFHGDLGSGSPTGMIFCTYGGSGIGSGSACTIFNNLFVGTGYTNNHDSLLYFHSADGNPLGPHNIYNNTFINGGYQISTDGDTTTKYTVQNNVFVGDAGGDTYYYIQNSSANPFSDLTADHNVYFGGRAEGAWNWGNGAAVYSSLSSWQSASGGDANATTSDPKLDTNYHPQTGSSVSGRAANLTGVGIASLDMDKSLNPRPSSGSWDSGIYNLTSGAGAPAPPAALTAQVQ